MKIRIMPMKTSDIEQIKNLEKESSLSPWSIDDYVKEISRNDSITIVAKENSKVIGFAVARLIMNFPNYPYPNIEREAQNPPENEAEIYNIAVRESHQNKGVGTLLLNKLSQTPQKYNAKRVFLEVRESNHKAIKFYLKNNFTKSGLRKNFYTNPVEDAVLMTKHHEQANNYKDLKK